MPRKKKAAPSAGTAESKALLKRIHDRYDVMREADEKNRRDALDDMRFANEPGAQWDQNMVKERGERAAYEFNKLRINAKKVVNDIRFSRPQGKVIPVERGDKAGAELREGLLRNIANMSDLDTVTDQASEYLVDGGMTAWRVVTEYAADDIFDQDIFIRAIKNPFCLYADPSCQDVLKRDAEDWILTERISTSSFESKYGEAEKANFTDLEEFDDQDEWSDEHSVRICEYWWREPKQKEIWLVEMPSDDGTVQRITVDADSDEAAGLTAAGIRPVRTRSVVCYAIKMCVASGNAILEGPVEWAGTQFPFVMIFGEHKIIDGEARWWGLHRFAKDAQRSYNVSRTAIDETIALAPQAKWWATADQAAGLTGMWAEAHKKNFPFLLYNADPKSPGPPVSMNGANVPAALLQQAAVAAQDIRDVTGLHETSFGQEGEQKSGIAIGKKQAAAQTITYNFPDNVAKGMKRTWEIVLNLIPHIYDAERELRIIGKEGEEQYVTANKFVMDPAKGVAVRVNDLTSGKYDVVVTTGPSFATQRQEASQVWSDLASRDPRILAVAGDLIARSFDLPYSEEIGNRLQSLLPPEVKQSMDPNSGAQAALMMAQANQLVTAVKERESEVNQAARDAEKAKAEAEKATAQVNTAIANLKTEEARFAAQIEKAKAILAQKEAQLAQKEAQLAIKAAGDDKEGEKEALSNDMAEAFVMLQKQQNEFMASVTSALGEIGNQTKVVVAPAPRPTKITARRVNGELVAEVTEYQPSPTVQ